MSATIDEAAQRLFAVQNEIVAELAKPLNESGTRFRILDRFLLEVLRWHHANVETEEAVSEGFVDYSPARNADCARVRRVTRSEEVFPREGERACWPSSPQSDVYGRQKRARAERRNDIHPSPSLGHATKLVRRPV